MVDVGRRTREKAEVYRERARRKMKGPETHVTAGASEGIGGASEHASVS